MRSLKFLAISSILCLSGCLDSTSSVASAPSPGFVLSPRYLFDAKIVLRAAEGRWGPMFLMTHGLSIHDSSGALHQFGGLFPYGMVNTGTPWIDKELFVDYQTGRPTLSFWDLRTPFKAASLGTTNWIELDQCEDLPKSVFQTAKENGQNPTEHHPLLRVGRFVFATAQNPGYGRMSVSRTGVALIRMGDLSKKVGECSRFEETDEGLAAKWIDLPPYKFDTGDTTKIMGRILSAVESDFGIYLTYWLDDTPANPNLYRYYLASIDTAGVARVLDSSLLKPITQLIRVGGRILALGQENSVFELNPRSNSAPVPLARLWKIWAFPRCYDVEGRCVLSSSDKLYLFDTSSFETRSIDATGLETNVITGVVSHQDTVYVSTLSGVFTKPVSRFFDPAK